MNTARSQIAEILRCAKDLEKAGSYWDAQSLYKAAVARFKALADKETDFNTKKNFYDELSKCNDRIQSLNACFDFNQYKERGMIVQNIQIVEHTFNYNYATSVFHDYCSANVREIVIYEAAMCFKEHFKCLENLVRRLHSKCPKLKLVILKCRRETGAGEAIQRQLLEELQNDLKAKGLKFTWDFILSLLCNDNTIVFSTGIVFQFERGIHTFTFYENNNGSGYYKTAPNHISIWQIGMEKI